MDIETLNSLFSHAGYVTFKEGPGGLPIALITTPHATAAITPYGGHLLSYRFAADDTDLLFVSENAIFKEGTAIRGGVPVCWPWFGPDPEQKGRSDHGLARTRMWNVVSTDLLSDQECGITLEFTDTPETYALWPHRFRLTLTLTVGRKMSLELTTQNLGDEPFILTQALHTYFSVQDIGRAEISGLEGCEYVDKTDGGILKRQNGLLQIDHETDRVYMTEGDAVVLHDPVNTRNIHMVSKGSRSTVMWNPWKRICEEKTDLSSDDYQKMVCIETANALADSILLEPRQTHSLSFSCARTAD